MLKIQLHINYTVLALFIRIIFELIEFWKNVLQNNYSGVG